MPGGVDVRLLVDRIEPGPLPTLPNSSSLMLVRDKKCQRKRSCFYPRPVSHVLRGSPHVLAGLLGALAVIQSSIPESFWPPIPYVRSLVCRSRQNPIPTSGAYMMAATMTLGMLRQCYLTSDLFPTLTVVILLLVSLSFRYPTSRSFQSLQDLLAPSSSGFRG